MAWIDDLGSTLRKNMKMHESSYRTAHTNINEDNEDTRTWAEFLNREGEEHKNDKIYRKKGPM